MVDLSGDENPFAAETNLQHPSAHEENMEQFSPVQMGQETTLPSDVTSADHLLSSNQNSDAKNDHSLAPFQHEMADYHVLVFFDKFLNDMGDENPDKLTMEEIKQGLQRLINYTRSLEVLVKNVASADHATVDRLQEGKEAGLFNPQWEIPRAYSGNPLHFQDDGGGIPRGLHSAETNYGLPSHYDFVGFSQFQIPENLPLALESGLQPLKDEPATYVGDTFSKGKAHTSELSAETSSNLGQKKRGRGRPPKKRPVDALQTQTLASTESGDVRLASVKKRSGSTEFAMESASPSEAHVKTTTFKKVRSDPSATTDNDHGNDGDRAQQVKRGRGRPKTVR